MIASTSFFTEKKHGAVLILEMNRPPSNGLNIQSMKLLQNRLGELAKDSSVRCVVISSAIPKYFSSGLDLEEFFSLTHEKRYELFHELLNLFRALVLFPKPTIAVIPGFALLGGWILAMGCDFRYMAQENGKMALSEIKLGISPTSIFIRAITGIAFNKSAVKELIFTGKTLRAEEALSGGFVDKLFPSAALMEESLKAADKLTEMPSQTYASVKRSYKEWELGDIDLAIEKSKKEFMEVFEGPEAKEGFKAAQEKRRPKYH